MELPELVTLIDAAAEESDTRHHWSSSLSARLGTPVAKPLAYLQFAVDYVLIGKSDERRRQWGVFGPCIEIDSRCYPPPFEQLPQECAGFWADAFHLSKHPLTRARLADLLWESRHERPDIWARESVESYLLITDFPSYDRASWLARALEIAGSLNDPELVERVADSASRLALSAVEADDPAGAAEFLGVFMSAPARSRPPQLFDIAQRALEMSSDPFQRDLLSEVCEELAQSPEMRGELRRARVRSWLDRADGETGLSAFHWLARAGEEADRFGFPDLSAESRRRIDAHDDSDTWTEISTEMSVPTEEIERLISAIVGDDNLKSALRRFAAYGPPSGTHEENSEVAQKVMEENPIQFLMMGTVIDENGVLIKRFESEEEKFEHQIVKQEAFGIFVRSRILEDALDKICERYQPKADQDFSGIFDVDFIDEGAQDALIRAHIRYCNGDFEAAGLIALPLIERIIRGLFQRVGIPTNRLPRGDQAGGVRTLGDLLAVFRGRLDESWRRYLVNLLTEPTSFNLRNRYHHGLALGFSRVEATLVLHACGFLALLRLEEREA